VLIVVKVGGALFAQGVDNLAADVQALAAEHQIVLVHGGGPQINALCDACGIPAKQLETTSGMKSRYTNPEVMRVVKQALAGEVNKGIVEALRRRGVNAFGFTGLDGGTIRAQRKSKIMAIVDGRRLMVRDDYSGKVEGADPAPIRLLLGAGYVPVIGSMCVSEEGEAVNVDGDRAAAAVAAAVGADTYISLTDVEGVYTDLETREVVPRLNRAEAAKLMEQVTGGMKKKLFAALEALDLGLSKVVVYSGTAEKPLSGVLFEGRGTIITAD
jgi:acetylglutamate/LysW-gamma-L-alpha-aminoadipate kinase